MFVTHWGYLSVCDAIAVFACRVRLCGHGKPNLGPCVGLARHEPPTINSLILLFIITCSFELNSLRSFTLSDLQEKPWSPVSPLLPPETCLPFYHT